MALTRISGEVASGVSGPEATDFSLANQVCDLVQLRAFVSGGDQFGLAPSPPCI